MKLTASLKSSVRRVRTAAYRRRQEYEAELILVGYVGCSRCDDAIPIYSPGLDVQEDEDGNVALCCPVEVLELEAHRLMHEAEWAK